MVNATTYNNCKKETMKNIFMFILIHIIWPTAITPLFNQSNLSITSLQKINGKKELIDSIWIDNSSAGKAKLTFVKEKELNKMYLLEFNKITEEEVVVINIKVENFIYSWEVNKNDFYPLYTYSVELIEYRGSIRKFWKKYYNVMILNRNDATRRPFYVVRKK